MDPLWMFLLLVLVGSEALNITEVKAVLGQDVNLTCSIDVDDIYWYLEVHFNFRVGIGRTFSQTESNYFSPDCESKYVMSGNQLLIKNVSLEDIRLYYCGRKNNRIIVYGDVFRLHTKKSHLNASQGWFLSTTPRFGSVSRINQPEILLLSFYCYFYTLNPHLVSSVSQHALGGVVEVNEGAESVLLPCVYSDKLPDDPFLIWTRSDLSPNSVHLRRENGDDLKNQNQRFRNRTSMNPDALDTGNFSLTLRKPQQSDGGNYTCSISGGREELNLKQIHLKVKEPDQQPQSDSGTPLSGRQRDLHLQSQERSHPDDETGSSPGQRSVV
uniref:Ig-like domain-containing protein n=1 Tax=Xiphophorus maculatus TaxID=8083 RepID=A0A3B5R789_XIPMA